MSSKRRVPRHVSALLATTFGLSSFVMAETITPEAGAIMVAEAVKPEGAISEKKSPSLDNKESAVDATLEEDVTLEEVVVSGVKAAIPNTSAGVTAQQIAQTINAINSEDALKHLPGVYINKIGIGALHHGALSIRTSAQGHGQGARSLIYADSLLLSNLIGNDETPRWNMLSLEEIERIDVLYGPFSAAYPGNSIGGVVQMTTRMPDEFEANVRAQTFMQKFNLYGTNETYNGSQLSASLGDRNGNLAWYASFNRLDSTNTPINISNRPASTTAALGTDTVVTGAIHDLGTTNEPRVVLGATGIETTVQNNFKIKLAYDISPTLRTDYTLGFWQDDSSRVSQSYLRDTAGNTVSAGNVNINGVRYVLAPSVFAPSNQQAEHWMHGLSLKTNTQQEWDWEVAASAFNYGKDERRSPTIGMPAAQNGGAGRITSNDHGWKTLDLKGIWRPELDQGNHEVSFGYHYDRYTLDTVVMNTANWLSGDATTRFSAFAGTTETQALYLQDAYDFAPDWRLTLGARSEHWNASGGAISNTSTTVNFNERTETFLSPKAAISLQATPRWLLRASLGKAYRMPTVKEMFQGNISLTDGEIENYNENLKPEQVWAGDLTAERDLGHGLLRVSLFHEKATDSLSTQPILGASPAASNIQNIDEIRTRGVEVAFEQEDVGLQGLHLTSSITYTDSEVLKNDKAPTSVGKKQRNVPDWRASAVATWTQSDKLSYSLGARYRGTQYATLDNSDVNRQTLGGYSRYFMVDTRVNYNIAKQYTASIGVDNLNNYTANSGHPYGTRMLMAELKYTH